MWILRKILSNFRPHESEDNWNLVVDVVVGDAVVDHEVFAAQLLVVGQEAAPVVAVLRTTEQRILCFH